VHARRRSFSRCERLSAPTAPAPSRQVIPSDPTLLDDVGDITAELDATACWDGHEPDVETIGLAVREAIANAIVHGNVWCWSMNKGF
jgi:hypothetical protein